MSKFKAGDKVRIVKCSGEDAWYRNNIGSAYTIGDNPTTLHPRDYWYIAEKPAQTIFVNDLALVGGTSEQGVDMNKELTTAVAILHLQSLVDLTGDDVQIIIQENELFVKLFDKTFYCENAEVLEEVCKAASCLSRQELT